MDKNDEPADHRELDFAAYSDTRNGIQQGLEQAKSGEGRDIDEFFAAFEAEHGLSR